MKTLILFFLTISFTLCETLFEETGEVISRKDLVLTSRVNARIIKILFQKGSKVSDGEILVELDHREMDAKIRVKESEIRVGMAKLELSRIDTRDSKRELERYQDLFSKNSVSRQVLDQQETRHLSAIAQEKILEEDLKKEEANLSELNTNLSEYFLRAPFAGIILDDRNIAPGQMVFPGNELIRIADLDDLRIQTKIPAIYWDKLSEVKSVKIRLDGVKQEAAGEISILDNFIDPKTRSRGLEILLKNHWIEKSGYLFEPGMFAWLSFEKEQS